MSIPRIALATAADVWREDTDAALTQAALDAAGAAARPAVWDDPDEDWEGFDLVVVRSTWDYVPRRHEFLAWAHAVEQVTELANPAAVLRWNTDKRYLADLAAASVPTAPTTFLLATELDPEDPSTDEVVRAALPGDGDVVVKPTVSAGSRDTVRHPPEHGDAAVAHATALLAAGRDVMVQPYLGDVDTFGETGMVYLGGEFSHGFRKGPLLEPGGAPVSGLYAEEEISPRVPSDAERAVADAVLAAVDARFGDGALLYARVDVLPGPDGAPVLLELELTEPSFFLACDGGSPVRMAHAFLDRARRAAARR
ncbi:MAG: ATP-grasp domain-containing protein [Microthrixaceae bacterium]